MIGHADCSDHRVEAEHYVQNGNLDQGADKSRGRFADALRLGGSFQGGVDLVGTFGDKEQPPQQQDQVSARDSLVQHGEERLGETHHPGQREQQQDAGAHGEPQPQNARFLALSLRQAADQDGDKDDVVDAQHDFEQGKGRESNPGGGIKNPFQHD